MTTTSPLQLRQNIFAAKQALEAERSTASYAKHRQSALQRRERTQTEYVSTFAQSVLEFLSFAPRYSAIGRQLAACVTAHDTPVGSGTVARTERIPVEERAQAAVIAWMRHQTTAYDTLSIPRVKGMRREVRRELAEISFALLNRHRSDVPHPVASCPLCSALFRVNA